PAVSARHAQLAADLDSHSYSVRQAAMSQLRDLGEQSRIVLQKALAKAANLETRRRIQYLLTEVQTNDREPQNLRPIRALEVLEHASSLQAHKVLEELLRARAGTAFALHVEAALQRKDSIRALR